MYYDHQIHFLFTNYIRNGKNKAFENELVKIKNANNFKMPEKTNGLLTASAMYNNMEAMDIIIKHGIYYQTEKSDCIHSSIRNENIEMFKILIELFELEKRKQNNWSSRVGACELEKEDDYNVRVLPLICAVNRHRYEMFDIILPYSNPKAENSKALERALISDNEHAVRKLFDLSDVEKVKKTIKIRDAERLLHGVINENEKLSEQKSGAAGLFYAKIKSMEEKKMMHKIFDKPQNMRLKSKKHLF